MKKIISLIAAFSFLLCINVYADDEPTIAEDFSRNAKILSAMKICSYTSNDALSNVTQEQFVKILNAMTGGNIATDEDFEAMGILPFCSTTKYVPESIVSVSQAIAALVTVCGYDYLAKEKGGYPSGTNAVARNIGILGNENTYIPLSVEVMVRLVSNALDTDAMEQNNFGETLGFSKSGESVMEKYLNIKEGNGILETTSAYSLNGKSVANSAKIIIGGTEYNTSSSVDGLFGLNVNFYYRTENKEKTVIYIEEDGNKITEIKSNDLMNYSDYTYKYQIDEKMHNIGFPKSISVIYNYELIRGNEISHVDFCPDYGRIRLIDNTGDNRYDILIIESFKTYTATGFDSASGSIFTQSGNTLVIDDQENKLIDSYNNPFLIDKLCMWDSVSVFYRTDGEIAKAVVSQNNMSGKIDQIKSDNKIVVMGSEFEVERTAFAEITSKLSAGDTACFYIDYMGYIVAYKATYDDWSFGYLISVKNSNSALDKKCMFKILSVADKKICIFDGTEKITVDGNKIEAATVCSMLLDSDGYTKDSVIRYKINSKGLLYELDLPVDNEGVTDGDDNLQRFYSSPYKGGGQKREGFYYRPDAKNFITPVVNATGSLIAWVDGFYVADSTPIIFVPADRNDEGGYTVKTTSAYASEKTYVAEAYRVGNNTMLPDVVIIIAGDGVPLRGSAASDINRKGEITLKERAVMVGDISSVINDKGDGVKKVTIYGQFGTEDLYTANEEILASENVKKGDIVRLYRDSYDRIAGIEKIVGYEDFLSRRSFNSGGALSDSRYLFAHAYSFLDPMIALTVKSPDSLSYAVASDYYTFNLQRISKIYQYDSANDKITTINGNNIVTYKGSMEPDITSMVFIQTINGTPSLSIYVYK